jgi:hypothetical protein
MREKNFPVTAPPIPPSVHLSVVDSYESALRVKEMADYCFHFMAGLWHR